MDGSPITITNLSVRPSRRRTLLHIPSLQVPAHKLTAIIGPNGAGKSTLLRALLSAIDHRGQLALGGSPLPAQSWLRARLLAWQPQGRSNACGLTAREFVRVARMADAPWWQRSQEADPRDAGLLELTGAQPLADRAMDTLSGGEAARVALAATLSNPAHWLLLDEPFASADAGSARQLYGLLRELVSSGQRSVVVVEHDLGLARSFADHVVVIGRDDGCGGVAISGDTDEVFASPTLAEAMGTELLSHQFGERTWAVVAAEPRGRGQP